MISRYEGAAPLLPSTNNGLESINGHLKDDWLGRRKDKVGVFLGTAKQYLADFSTKAVDYAFVPKPSDDLWRDAKSKLDSRGFVFKKVSAGANGMARYVVSQAGKQHTATEEEYISLFDNPDQIRTWGDYLLLLKDWHVVSVTAGPGGKFCTCTCAAGWKRYRCVHSLAADLGLKFAELPDGAKPLPQSGVARKRGRPRLITGGLGGGKK